jgi:hypothetical protein
VRDDRSRAAGGGGADRSLYFAASIHPTERIQINGRAITPEQFAHAFDTVHRTALRLIADGTIAHHPSYFETRDADGV